MRTKAVENAEEKRQDQDIGHWEARLGQVGSDHLTHAVGVDETDVEYERNKVVVEDHWLQVEVDRDQDPGGEEGEESVEGQSCRLLTLAADSQDVKNTVQ